MIDTDTNTLVPALMHHGKVKLKNPNAYKTPQKYAFIERLDDKAEKEKVKEKSNSQKADKPVDKVKVDKQIESVGVKDYDDKRSPEKL